MKTIREFLSYDSKFEREDSYRLKDWKKDKRIVVWLHTKVGIETVWRHNWPKVVSRKDKLTGDTTNEIWGGLFKCSETDETLKRQNLRFPNGERKYPPQSCPMCKMLEVIRTKVQSKEIGVADPVFKFPHQDLMKERVLYAGSIYNAFKNNCSKLTPEEIRSVRQAGIRLAEVWRDDMTPKCNHVIAVVDNEDPFGGVKLAQTSATLGDRLIAAISKEMHALKEAGENSDNGDPSIRPYPFEWTYKDQEKDGSATPPQDRYNVCALTHNKPSPEILEAITNSEVPSMIEFLAEGNQSQLMVEMQQYALVDLPWNQIFGTKVQTVVASIPKQEATAPIAAEPTPAFVAMTTCIACALPMREDELICKKCGAEYGELSGGGETVLIARPCTKCKTMCQMTDAEKTICSKCATIFDTETWEVLQEGTPQQAVTKGRVRTSPAGDKIPWG